MNKPTTDNLTTFTCHARRHMSGAVFKTYDAILAMAKSGPRSEQGWLFYGRIRPTLANHTNTDPKQLLEHIKKLVADGWMIKCEPPEGTRERTAQGHLKPNVYIVLEHEEYCQFREAIKGIYKDCPVFDYDVTGERMGEIKEQPVNFQMVEALKHPAGRVALVLARVAGQLPGATWDEIMENLQKHPENMPKKEK